jgi:hypothetical protein
MRRSALPDSAKERSARPGGFRFRRARKALDPFLVIAVERARMLAPDLLEEERALLRLLAQDVTTIVRNSAGAFTSMSLSA